MRFKFNGQVTLLELIEIAERIPEYYLGTVYQKLVIANFEKSTRQDIIKYRRRVRGRSIYDLSDPLLLGETGPSADSYILLKPLIIGILKYFLNSSSFSSLSVLNIKPLP